MRLVNWSVLGISVEEWALAVAFTLITYLIITNVIRYVSKRLAALAEKTNNKLDDVAVEMLMHTNRLIILLIALLIAFSLLDLPPKWQSRLLQGWTIAIGMQVALWLNFGINVWMRSYKDRAPTSAIIFLMRFVVWLTLLLAIMANIGTNTNPPTR